MKQEEIIASVDDMICDCLVACSRHSKNDWLKDRRTIELYSQHITEFIQKETIPRSSGE